MPTRPTKGGHGGSQTSQNPSGPQKATFGSALPEDVADERRDVTAEEDDRTGPQPHDT